MRRWSETANAIAATSRTSQKIALLASYLLSLEPAELRAAATFMVGRPFPERESRTTGLGWSAISKVIETLAGPESGGLGAAYDRSSDIGKAVEDVLVDVGHEPVGEPPTVVEVAAVFQAIADARGTAAKSAIFAGLLTRSDPVTARAIIRVLSGELRIGLREGHLEAAIAKAFGQEVADVQWAGMLTGDLGRTAELARDDRLGSAELTLFRPLKSMLAHPAADEAEVITRLGTPVWVEDKYDGIRAQLHRRGADIRLYSRDLNEVSGQFPEVVRAAAELDWDGILDGEVLGWHEGAALPFLQLQTRLGRKDPSPQVQAAVPVIYVAFDALALGVPGKAVEPLLRMPLRDRRARLEALGLGATPGFGLAKLVNAPDEAALRLVFDESQQRGNEGLMVKDPDSIYSPGRRGYGWLKLKRPLTTLDCVVIGVEVGHGKRHGVLSDYTFAVRDDRSGADGKLVTIGKAYTGLTDAEITEMTRWFEDHTIQRFGRYRLVDPEIVVEIAFDVIHRSARHASGYAMRFPRIVRIRTDKDASQIDVLSTVTQIHDRLQVGGRYGVMTAGEVEPRETSVPVSVPGA
ncbi:MAG: ATP-dependent DNA ligase [Candidatus Limnocylindrales bacterium]